MRLYTKYFAQEKQDTRIVFGVPSRTHCTELFIKLGVLSLPFLYVFQVLSYNKEISPSLTVNTDVHSHLTRKNKEGLQSMQI